MKTTVVLEVKVSPVATAKQILDASIQPIGLVYQLLRLYVTPYYSFFNKLLANPYFAKLLSPGWIFVSKLAG